MDYKQQAERLTNTYADAILRLSYAYLKNTQDAQDVCQTVFVRLLTEPREFESGGARAGLHPADGGQRLQRLAEKPLAAAHLRPGSLCPGSSPGDVRRVGARGGESAAGPLPLSDLPLLL